MSSKDESTGGEEMSMREVQTLFRRFLMKDIVDNE
jgi:hypothetical protein